MTDATAQKPEGPPTSVLIVEDEWMVAWDLERSLKEMGYLVIATVDSSHEALRVVAERRPDVALMDIRINGDSDGIATATALEKFDVPVVYLTAYTDDATLSRAARSKAYGYVVKPFTSREVKSAIEVARHKHAADSRVARSERWLAGTLRSIGDAVVACDPDQKVSFMNPVAEALTGWKEAEARGRPVDEVVQIHSAAGPRSPLKDAMQARRRQSLPAGARLVPRAGGEPAEIDDSASPIEQDGSVLGAVLCFRDVTEQRRQQRQAEASERLASLGLMATSVEHELNHPLTFVQSNVGLIAVGLDRVDEAIHRGDLGGPELASQVEEMAEMVDEVRLGTERIRQIVSDLNVFNRPASDHRSLVDVREVLQWALRVTAGQVRARGRLVSDLQPTPKVLASEVWLGQVFVSLLVHAAQALPLRMEGKGEIRVRCGPAADGRVFVSVGDTGAGLTRQAMEKIFTPFGTTRAPGGGMGLAISHTLVTAMGGEMRAWSTEGQGSTFEVLIPSGEDPVELPGPAQPPEAGEAQRTRVLVIDDEVLVGRAIQRVLSRKHEVVAVNDPHEALRLLEGGETFDLILCDVMMPGLSGAELYERLKARSPATAERVVFLTGGAFTSAARQFLDSVSNRRLEKPFDARSLEALVDALLAW